MKVRHNAVAWCGVDPRGEYLIETAELDERVLKAIAAGMSLRPGQDRTSLTSEFKRHWFLTSGGNATVH